MKNAKFYFLDVEANPLIGRVRKNKFIFLKTVVDFFIYYKNKV